MDPYTATSGIIHISAMESSTRNPKLENKTEICPQVQSTEFMVQNTEFMFVGKRQETVTKTVPKTVTNARTFCEVS